MTAARFGRYRLERLLGKGGMGQVWLAYDTTDRRHVALKLLPAELAADAVYRKRFEREAQVAAALRDPHIVPIHRHGAVDGRLYIEMAFVEGTDLAARLSEGGPLAAGAALDILGQVAAALDAAHRAGLVHRDVKPSNILVGSDGSTYLIDFGIARGTGQTSVTTTGLAIGTWAYMAPERFSGRDDARADVYSLACVLYESLTGDRPYGDADPAQQMHGHLMTEPPSASSANPDVPAGLDAVIARGMAKEPGDRYASAGEFLLAAREVVSSTLGVSRSPRPTRVPQQPVLPPTRVETVGPGSAEGGQPPTPIAAGAGAPAQPSEPAASKVHPPTKVMPAPGPTPTLVQTRVAPRDIRPQGYPAFVAPPNSAPPGAVPPGWTPSGTGQSLVPVGYAPVRPPLPATYPYGSKRWYLRRKPVPVVRRPRSLGPVWPSRGPAYVPPPRRRRGGVLRKVIGALVVIFLAPFVFAVGCLALIAAGGRDESSTAPPPTAMADENPERAPNPPPDGPAPAYSAVRDGKFEFAVTDVDSGVPRVGLQSARGAFLIVTLAVRNISDEVKWFLPFGQKLVDAQGNALDHDTTATAWQAMQSRLGYSFELRPGASATTVLVFDVPAGSAPAHLELHDFVLSNGVTVALD
ncbi:protein kinase domain-containing protein [Nocardia lijiangensis]|uniref:serine/threonine-protein kinase n=1 Tax=Nocardia lijiangensis TaxID=299618 RepID=UPI003D7118F4